MSGLKWSARLYLAGVVLAALVVLVLSVPRATQWPTIAIFAALLAACESMPVWSGARVRFVLTVVEPVAIAAAIILGPAGAAIVGAASIFVIDDFGVVKRTFNAAQICLSTFACAVVYQVLGGPTDITSSDFPVILLVVAAAGFTYSIVNGALVGVVLRLVESARTVDIVRDVLRRMFLPTAAYSSLGFLIVIMWQEVGPLALALVLMPLFVARWAMGQFAAERAAYQATIGALVQAVETKDAYTRGHSERVARASVMIARQIAMNEDRVDAIEYAGTLHDVGKLGVPTAVLQKAGKLTDDEFDTIKTHPVRGHEIVRDIEFLDEALTGIFHHHERMDGRGYPSGLKGMEIPEFARVIAVADAFDSMTSTRSYRGARPVGEAIAELERCKDTQFDSTMVDAMVRAVAADGWLAAVPPTADEIAAQTSFSIDDDDPVVDMRSQVGP